MELGAAMEVGAEIEVLEGGPEEPPVTLVNARAALCLEALPDPSSDDVSEGEELPPPPRRRGPAPSPGRPRPRCARCGRSFAHPARLARHRARHAGDAGKMAAPGGVAMATRGNMAAPELPAAAPGNMAAPAGSVLDAILEVSGSVVVAMETLGDAAAAVVEAAGSAAAAAGSTEFTLVDAASGDMAAVAMVNPGAPEVPASPEPFPAWSPGDPLGEAEVVPEGPEIVTCWPEAAAESASGGDAVLFRLLSMAEGGPLVLEVAPAPLSPPPLKP